MAHLKNIDRVHPELTAEEALHFARQLRNARASALADAEGWQELIFVFERLAKFVTRCQKTTLGKPEATKVFLTIMRRGQIHGLPNDEHLELLRQQVVVGRTDGKHTAIISGLSSGTQYAAKNSFLIKAELGKGSAKDND